MPRGNNVSIPSNTGSLQKTLFSERQTILVLNPNNGILYVRMQGSADPTTWDWVVPSQSRAYLPGPWLEYGLYYVDQSGAGATGNVTVFESDQRFDMPDYAAIGVARLAQASSMDVVEGPIPANPGAGIARLWVDTNNFLHVLTPTGADYVVADTGTTLGGVLTGNLPNPGLANPIPSGLTIPTPTLTGLITEGVPAPVWNTGPHTNDWFRLLTANTGLYSNIHNQGLVVEANGLYDYTSGRQVALKPVGFADLAANSATKVHSFIQSAPAGSTTSTVATALPAPFGTQMNLTTLGGPLFLIANLHCVHSVAGAFGIFAVQVDSSGFTTVHQNPFFTAGQDHTFSIFWVSGNTLAAGAHTLQVGWFTSSGTITFQTAIYSWLGVFELAK